MTPKSSDARRSKHEPLRVLCYNVRYFGHRLKGLASTRTSEAVIAGAIGSLDPPADIVCLQEIETISLRSRVAYRRARPWQTQLESFMAALESAFRRRGAPFPYQGYYFRAHTNRLRKISLYTTGLAILVNVRRLEVEAHNAEAPERITHHHVGLWKDRKQTRICAHIHVRAPDGRRLHVFNTHLSLPTPFHRDFWSGSPRMGWGVNQVHEARTLATFVHKYANGDPFIVCGDFNSAPGSPVFRYLTEEAGFVCAQAALGQIAPGRRGGFSTAGFLRMRMHLDHLFSGAGVDWLDLDGTAPFGDRTSPFSGLSDHVPLIARLRCA